MATTETSLFSNLLKKTADNRSLPTRMREARAWVQKHATSAMKNPSAVIKAAPNTLAKTGMSKSSLDGRMVLFEYKATTAKQLPYWDRFPLVFPFNFTSDGMYGINMHYLPYQMRASLMDSLYNIADSKNLTEDTKIELSYNTLQAAARNRFFQPCVKRYLNTGLASRIVTIPATEWNIALFLPLERFQKASTATVHEHSRRIIRGQ